MGMKPVNILAAIQEWAEFFETIYGRKPNLRDRESFMLGVLKNQVEREHEARLYGKVPM